METLADILQLTADLIEVEGDGSDCFGCGDPIFLKGYGVHLTSPAGRPLGILNSKLCQSCGDGLINLRKITAREGPKMAKMNKPKSDGEPKVRVVEIHEEVATDSEVEALTVADFATREDEADMHSVPAPVRTVNEDDIPDAGKVWYRVQEDGTLKRWKQTPAD